MPHRIAHRDIFALLALELDRTPAELRALFFADASGADRLADTVEASGLARSPLLLSEPVGGVEGGPPLLAAGVSLSPQKIRALLTRQRQSPEFPIGPLVMAPDDATIAHYRARMLDRMGVLMERGRGDEGGNLRTVRDRIAGARELEVVEDLFRQAVSELFSQAASLCVAVPVVGNPENASLLEKGINRALVALAVLLFYEPFSGVASRDRALKEAGKAALLRDFGYLSDRTVAGAERLRASADMARRMGVEGKVAALIEERTQDSQTRVIAAAEAFVAKSSERGPLFEAMKGLYYLAQVGCLDRRAVQVLGRLFLPKVKSFVIEQATRVGRLCPRRGTSSVLWPVTGDNLPSIFLCQAPDCPHETPQVSHLVHDVRFEFEGKTATTIRRGDYFTCSLLTTQLKQLYATMSEERGRELAATTPDVAAEA